MSTGDQVYDYEVMDSTGKKLGPVDGVWVDDATDELEFVGVKTGWLMGKTHIIPVTQNQADPASRTINVPHTEDEIKGAPSFATNAELSPNDEDEIYSYYGVDRSTAPSPTGLPSGQDAGTSRTARQYDSTDTEERTIPLAEEQLQVGKRSVEVGRVRLRKVVRTEHQEVPVELRHEEVSIERVDAAGQNVPGTAFQEQEVNVPLTREEAVVTKEAHTTGGVQVDKSVETETRMVGGEVRKEDVEVDRDTEAVDRP